LETNHHLTAEHLCKMYGINYESVSDENTLKSSLETFYSEEDRPKLLEIFTPKQINDEVLLNYFDFIR